MPQQKTRYALGANAFQRVYSCKVIATEIEGSTVVLPCTLWHDVYTIAGLMYGYIAFVTEHDFIVIVDVRIQTDSTSLVLLRERVGWGMMLRKISIVIKSLQR